MVGPLIDRPTGITFPFRPLLAIAAYGDPFDETGLSSYDSIHRDQHQRLLALLGDHNVAVRRRLRRQPRGWRRDD